MGYPPWVESVDRFNVHNLALLAGVPGAFVWGIWILQLRRWVVGQHRPAQVAGVADPEEAWRRWSASSSSISPSRSVMQA